MPSYAVLCHLVPLTLSPRPVGNIRTEEKHVARAWDLLRSAAARDNG